MKLNKDINYKKYIFGIVILLVLYFLIYYKHISSDYREDTNLEISENIKELNSTTKNLTEIANKDKEAIDKFFFNIKTLEKIRGLISTFISNKEFSINDNLKISLQQKGNPVKITYKRATFELIHNNDYLNGNPTDDINVVNDVVILDNPNHINEFSLIHDLRSYLIDGYGNEAFNNFLDKIIRDTIEENNKVIENIDK